MKNCLLLLALGATALGPARADLVAHYLFSDGDLLDNELGAAYTLAQVQAEGDGDAGTSVDVTLGDIDGIGTAIFPGGRSNSVDIAWLETAAGLAPQDFTVSFWFRLSTADGQVADQDESFMGLFSTNDSQGAGD